MQEKLISVSGRISYVPTRSEKFLWWLATAEEQIIKDCEVDRNRYAIVGWTVAGTWLFATLAWTYFFSTVVTSFIYAVPLGIFMGWIILNIDRALIKGINSRNKLKFLPLAFRGVLALTIGTFMAQPALLYLFDKEIHAQISVDNAQRIKLKQQKTDSLYAIQLSELQQQRNTIILSEHTKYQEVADARNSFIAETDGTGGTGKIGLKDIAKAKQAQYQKLDNEYAQLTSANKPALSKIDSAIASINQEKASESASFRTLLNDGFLTRTEALQNLIKDNAALQFRYYLLVVILMLIELMPVIAKSLLPDGSYSERVNLREQLEKETAAENHDLERALISAYNKQSFQHNKENVTRIFDEAVSNHRSAEGNSFNDEWNNSKENKLARFEQ
ncbi:MAG: hypothetical protein JWN76_2175 [Chitinophagaceae bacterium]|nr:hypothetical protein [Chitinophagaceae bacterium]